MIARSWRYAAPLAGLGVLLACSAGTGEEADAPPSFGGFGNAGAGAGAPAGLAGSGGGGGTPLGNAGTGGAPPLGQGGSAAVAAQGGSSSLPAGAGGSAPGAGGSALAGTGGSALGMAGTGGTSGELPPAGCDSLLLCDDFESAAAGGSPDPARWSLTLDFNPNAGPNANITIDDTTAHAGSQSVRVIWLASA